MLCTYLVNVNGVLMPLQLDPDTVPESVSDAIFSVFMSAWRSLAKFDLVIGWKCTTHEGSGQTVNMRFDFKDIEQIYKKRPSSSLDTIQDFLEVLSNLLAVETRDAIQGRKGVIINHFRDIFRIGYGYGAMAKNAETN